VPVTSPETNIKVVFQFNRETSTITKITNTALQKMDATVSPELILFKSVRGSSDSIATDNYQIDRKTLAYNQWGEHKYFGQYSFGEVLSAWKYLGTCDIVVANTEDNRI